MTLRQSRHIGILMFMAILPNGPGLWTAITAAAVIAEQEAIPWSARCDPSPELLDWAPRPEFALDVSQSGRSIVHPPVTTPYVLVDGTWSRRDSLVYDLRSGEVVGRVGPVVDRGCYCALSPNGKMVAMTYNRDVSPVVWSTETGKKLMQLDVPGDQRIRFADNERLMTYHGQRNVKLWSIPDGKLLAEIEYPLRSSWRTTDVTPGGNYALSAIERGGSQPSRIVVLDLCNGKSVGEVSVSSNIPARRFYCLAASPDGTEFACVWSNDEGAYLSAWSMKDGRQVAYLRLAQRFTEFTKWFDQRSRYRGHGGGAHLSWKPDGSAWLVAAAIHIDRKTGVASPILLPDPCACSSSGWKPRHLPGNFVLNVLRERPEGLLAVTRYDPTQFAKLRRAMRDGYLPADFRRPALTQLPNFRNAAVRQTPSISDRVPRFQPPVVQSAADIPGGLMTLEYAPTNGKSDVGVRSLWKPGGCGGDLFAVLGRHYTNDSAFWYLARYDLNSQEEVARFEPPAWARPIDISPSGRTVLTWSEDGRYDVWKFGGDHLLGFRPVSLGKRKVMLVDDTRFIQRRDRELVLRKFPSGDAVYRIASDSGEFRFPIPNRQVAMHRTATGWDVLDVESGEVSQRITLPEGVRQYERVVFSPGMKRVALILPIDLDRKSRRNANREQGRLTRALALVDLSTGEEITRLSLPQRYEKPPLWVSEDFVLIRAPFRTKDDPEVVAYTGKHLLIHVSTGHAVWRYLTQSERVRYSATFPRVWSNCEGDPRVPRPGRLIGRDLLTPELLEIVNSELDKIQPVVPGLQRLALDVQVELPADSSPIRVRVYRHDSTLARFSVTAEAIRSHFRRLMEDQGIQVVPDAKHRLHVRLKQETLDRSITPETLSRLRQNAVWAALRAKWLIESLEREGGDIKQIRVACEIALVDQADNRLASAEYSLGTRDSVIRPSSVYANPPIRVMIRDSVWQKVIEWCLDQSAQSILTNSFDRRKIKTSRLDGGSIETLTVPSWTVPDFLRR